MPKKNTATTISRHNRRHRVFVYGSLRIGCGNHGFLNDAKHIADGYIKGATMHDLGAYPAIRPVPNVGMHVVGEVYQVDDNGLQSLDMLEGTPHFYFRRLVRVHTDSGVLVCFAYYLANPTDRPVVNCGDWVQHLRDRRAAC